jgi:tryptophan synthase alpha chain
LTTARIDARFAALRQQDRAAFVAYIMGGDPDLAASLEILKGLPAAGADIIELGFPFSDPIGEGPTIQAAAQRSLANGTTLDDVLGLARAFRQDDQATPLILMGYLNVVANRGEVAFARDIADAGVDGVIIVDCPPEESGPLADALDAAQISLLHLFTPTSDDARMRTIAERASGFAYYVSVAGVTGVKEADEQAVAPAVARVRKASGLPVAVGFGIKTPERAAAIARVADAAVVGSALVDEVAAGLARNEDVTRGVLCKVEALAKAVHGARTAPARDRQHG